MSTHEPATSDRGSSTGLAMLIAQVRRRMLRRHALPWLLRGGAAGLTLAALLLVLQRLTTWLGSSTVWLALLLVAAGLGAGVMAAWATRPAMPNLLRGADRLLDLNDRLITAWELSGDDAPMLRLQRADALAHMQRLDLSQLLPLAPRRVDAASPALGAFVLAIALLLPAPHSAVTTVSNAPHVRINHAVRRISSTQQATQQLAAPVLSALPKAAQLRQAQITRILARLQKQLAAARNAAQALRAISQAQDALNRLSNPRAEAQRSALSSLASALANAAATRQLSAAIKSGNPSSIASAAQKLANQVSSISQSARNATARALQAAANAAAKDQALSSSLQNAATSLAQGDTAGAKAALNTAGKQASSDSAQTAQQNALDAANAALDNARNDVSGLDSSSNSPGRQGQSQAGAGNAGQGQGKGNGNSTGNGKGSGQGQGKGNGSGQGQGRGNGSGKGSGQGQGNGQGQSSGSGNGGSGGTGGKGLGGGRGGPNGSGQAGTNGDRVYVAGSQGQGPSSSTKGSQSKPSTGSIQPWSAVGAQYERSARASIDNSSLPPDQRALAKQYFDKLSH